MDQAVNLIKRRMVACYDWRKRTGDYEPRVNLTSDAHGIVHRREVLLLEL